MHRHTVAPLALAVLTALVVLAPPQASAQAPRRPTNAARPAPARTGGVEGDVYLSMQSGDVKKGAGLRVVLLTEPDVVVAAITTRCAAWERYYQTKPEDYDDHLAKGPQLEADLAAILSRTAVREVGTGMNAHYTFTGVPVGAYLLYTRFRIAKRNYGWSVPVRILAGQSLTVDLDTEKENSATIGCGWS